MSLADAARLLLDVWDTMRHRYDIASLYRPIAALRAALDTRSNPATPSEAALAAASHYYGEKSDEFLALAEHFDDFAAARLDAQRALWEEVAKGVYQIECDLRDRLGRAEAVIAAAIQVVIDEDMPMTRAMIDLHKTLAAYRSDDGRR